MELIPLNIPAKEDSSIVPWHQFPIWRAHKAIAKGTQNNLLFKTWGGIGDVICSEPTIRYALKNFRDCRISIATHIPEVFAHLPLHDVYNLSQGDNPILDDHLVFDTIPVQGRNGLIDQFLSHMSTNCVDFPALSAFRSQLPIVDREVILSPPVPGPDSILREVFGKVLQSFKNKYVIVHAGRHWQSKTFPVPFWNAVLDSIQAAGFTPVLIGKDGGESQGYVDTKTKGCVDLRDKTSLNETIWLLQHSPILICNDSSPLHMAVTGHAFIGYIASVKHPDFITHYRRGKFGWRMKNFSVGGMWEHASICPNRGEDIQLDNIDPKLIESFLPDPSVFGPWCKEKMDDYIYSRGV